MLFRNRLEVWNPGQLPYGLTVNKLLEPHKSLPANPLIADPLFWTGYVDKVGTGTEDIVNLCKDKGLKSPEYHQEEDFRVVIWRRTGNVVQSDPEVILSNPDVEKMDTTQKTTQIIMEMMKEKSEISIEELAAACGITRDGVNYHIRNLKKNNKIRRIGGDKGGHWEVIEDMES